jgi:putative Mn2+ efflux pump MntP
VLALFLVAVSVGLDNLGAATALGVSGADWQLRIRVALIFGVFEGVMPVVGLLLGHSLAHDLGAAADPIAGALLGLTGAYTIVTELGDEKRTRRRPATSVKHLVLLAGALSIDNLVIGFALGTYHVNLVVAAVTIAAVSVGLSLLGLEIGGRLGGRLGRRSGLVGGGVLMVVGVAVGTGLL